MPCGTGARRHASRRKSPRHKSDCHVGVTATRVLCHVRKSAEHNKRAHGDRRTRRAKRVAVSGLAFGAGAFARADGPCRLKAPCCRPYRVTLRPLAANVLCCPTAWLHRGRDCAEFRDGCDAVGGAAPTLPPWRQPQRSTRAPRQGIAPGASHKGLRATRHIVLHWPQLAVMSGARPIRPPAVVT